MTNIELVRSEDGDGGWSLHPAGYTDQDYAAGRVPILAEGEATLAGGEWDRPSADDWQRAEAKAAATLLGRLGGNKTSERKAAAVRENGRKGGRPRGPAWQPDRIIEQIAEVIKGAEKRGVNWAEAVDSRTYYGGHAAVLDYNVPGYDRGYYICTLTRRGKMIADVWVSGDSYAVQRRGPSGRPVDASGDEFGEDVE